MRDLPPLPPTHTRPMKLNTLVTLMVYSVTGAILLVIFVLYFAQITGATRDGVRDTALAVARTLADSPAVIQGLALPPDSNIIQPVARTVMQRNNLLFAVVTDMHGRRYSHPNGALLGKAFIGDDLRPALEDKENVAINHGVLGEALRVFTPVYNAKRQQIGVVAVGISLDKVEQQIARNRWDAIWLVLFSALLGALGAWGLVRMLKRVLFGLEPYQISALLEQRQAMLQSLREGVIAVDQQGHVTIINHAARQILNTSTSGHALHETLLLANLREVLQTGLPRQDQEINCHGRLLLCNTLPVKSNTQLMGAITTFRDKTEISQLIQRLDGMVSYLDVLRSHSHEFMNKLHVILGLLHMKHYAKLEEYVLQTANAWQNDVGTLQRNVKSPVVAGFLLGKINRARERGFSLTLSDASQVPDNPNEQQVAGLITVLGNLIENALDAQPEGEIGLLLHYQRGWLSAEVSDDGPGIAPEHLQDIFSKGFSTKGENRGVGLYLARQQIENLGGEIAVESEPGVFTQFFVQLPWNSERKSA